MEAVGWVLVPPEEGQAAYHTLGLSRFRTDAGADGAQTMPELLVRDLPRSEAQRLVSCVTEALLCGEVHPASQSVYRVPETGERIGFVSPGVIEEAALAPYLSAYRRHLRPQGWSTWQLLPAAEKAR